MKYKGKQHTNWTNHWLWVLCSWFLCSSATPAPHKRKQTIFGCCQQPTNVSQSFQISCTESLASNWNPFDWWQFSKQLAFFLCSPQILGYVILRVPMFVFPMFHGLKLNLFTGGRPQGLSQLSFQWAFWQVRKGTFLWNGCPTKSTNEGLFHTEAGWLFCGV